ncbi:MAG: FG-GAP-like repeat-containing protein, partial [Acidimicrobiales bacterium]
QGLPDVAELDGDGIDDVVIYAPGGSPDRIYSGRANRTLVALPLGVDPTYDVSVGDFDGDGRDDLLWFGYGVNESVRTLSDGNGQFTSLLSTIDDGESIPIIGDFDGDGLDDVLLYGPGSSVDEMWWSEPTDRGAVSVEPIQVKGTAYRPQVGDVNGDGNDDVLWYQPGAGADPLWTWFADRTKVDRILGVGGTFVPDLGRYTADDLDDVAWLSPTSASYLWLATGGGAFRSIALG